jgi:hypothetical protein
MQAAAAGWTAATLLPDAQEMGLTALVQQRLIQQQQQQQQQLLTDGRAGAGNDVPMGLLGQQQVDDEEEQAAAAAAAAAWKPKVATRLSAVLIDTAKDGDDGGEIMRKAARNLPGG